LVQEYAALVAEYDALLTARAGAVNDRPGPAFGSLDAVG
jgi:hypothetical protein